MIGSAGDKSLSIMSSTATYTVTGGVTNGGTGFAAIDTLGYRYAAIDLELSPSNTTSNAPSLITLGESDTTNLTAGSTSISDITAFHGLTATATNCGYLIPVTGVKTALNNIYRMNVDLRPRKRMLYVTWNPVTTMSGLVNVRLSRGEAINIAAASGGAQAWVEG
jgi:hypothetical protein